MLGSVARWVVPAANGEARPARPPASAAQAILDRKEWPGIRYLTGVIESPCLRPDGTVLDAPGYDAETGILYRPACDYPAIPDSPGLDDARGAAGRLLALVDEFPFVGEEHRAAWLAALLTPFARPAIDGPCPMFLFEASAAGSGKTLLARIIGQIATGRDLPVSELSTDSEEVRKTITSVLMEGDRIVLLDNATDKLGCSALDAVLTSTTFKGRILGRSERTAELPAMTVWFATGNNLQLRGDTHRRVILCRLVPPQERPEERQGYRIDNLAQHVRDNRPALVVDALTMLRAHALAGRPPTSGLPRMGSFEGWCEVVQRAVFWVLGVDPTASRTALTAENRGDSGRLGVFVDAVVRLGGNKPSAAVTTRQIVDGARRIGGDLAAVIDELPKAKNGEASLQAIGCILRSGRDRVVDGWRLHSTGETGHAKVSRWWVERVGTTDARPSPAPIVTAPAGDEGDAGDGSSHFAREWQSNHIGDRQKVSPASPSSPAARSPDNSHDCWAEPLSLSSAVQDAAA